MKLLLCVFGVFLHVTPSTALFGFNTGRFRNKISNYMDNLVSNIPCDKILDKMGTSLFKPIAHACECVIEDMKSREENDLPNIAELLGQISTLEEKEAALNEKMASTQTQLDEISEKLWEVCPDSSELREACSKKPDFEFVESADGCQAICYHASTDLVDYAGAEEACTRAGGSLITLETMEKNALVADTIRKNFGGNSFWIGLTFADGQWTWKEEGSVTFSDWANNEPDAKQNCASLNKAAEHRWFDWKCNTANKNGALCEIAMA